MFFLHLLLLLYLKNDDSLIFIILLNFIFLFAKVIFLDIFELFSDS